ncbi:MAG: GSCFA domain-containing protein [Bacteroides sp.]|nr:GSCFA domain-containing protein [Bacteroides sp.]
MNLYTTVDIPKHSLPALSQADPILLLGSCFATEMGQRLRQAKFACDVNPYGVLYNPLSISAALREVMAGRKYMPDDLFLHSECWHSPMHHGDFSSPCREEALQHINRRIMQAHELVQRLDVLILTFGTSYVYRKKSDGQVVGNCHKLPESCFDRRRLSVDEIVADYMQLLPLLLQQRPQLKVILTVSPIRHIRDGLHANQLSKATLLLAVQALQDAFPHNVFYFPAYELLLDELRDYRFYADDLVHPSAIAVDYVWQHFATACFTPETRQAVEACEEIGKALSHKPFHPESEAYKRFLGQIVLKIDRLNAKFPYLDFQNERELCRTLLNR